MKNDSDDRTVRAENRQLVLRLMAEFDQVLPTEQDSRSRLYSKIEEWGFLKCHHCGNSDVKKMNDRQIKCRGCAKKSWITSGTFFTRVKLVRPYLAAAYLLENGAVISASWFADLLGIAASSAACILKKFGMVIKSVISEDASVVHSISFIDVICRRSRESPTGKHPRAEFDAMDMVGENAAELRAGAGSDSGKDFAVKSVVLPTCETERKVFDLLSADPVHFDILCDNSGLSTADLAAALSMLELTGLVAVVPGNRFVRAVADAVPDAMSNGDSAVSEDAGLLMEIRTIIKQIHGGCSRKCLQIYMALFWCHFDTLRWGREALLRAIFIHPPIEYADIVAYISPPFIKVLPRPVGI